MSNDWNQLGQPVGADLSSWSPPPVPSRDAMCGRYCRLEALDPARHARDLFAANQLDSTGANWTYLAYGPFARFEDFCGWLHRDCLGSDPLYFSIIDLATEKAVGVASYLDIRPAIGSIEVGHLNYSPALQRTRAATEAMYLMMARAFELGYRRYQWKCNALNLPSRRAAQRLGFSYEGVFRHATIVKGRNRDTAWYAAIDSEWPLLRVAFEQWLAPTNFDSTDRQIVALSAWTAPILKQLG